MYWQETDPFESSSVTSKALTFAASVESAVAKAFDPLRIEKFFLTLENDAKNLNTSVGNGLQNNLKTIQDTIFNVYKEGLDYGFAYGDAKEYIDAIATSSNKMISITKENTINAIALGKAMGVGAKEAGGLYSSFMSAGMGQAVANQKLTEAFKLARQYGVDASTLTKTVADNVFKAAAYGFKDGVKGLTEMAIQAQRVGISMDIAQNAANKAFNPEDAIEMASSLQLLGGSAAGMGDVFGLMYDAQSDVGSLNDKIAKTTASMVDFNSKTGEFKINPAMRRDLTDYAASINSTYDEISKVAIKTRKEQEIMSKIPLGKFSDSEKSLIASMAEIGPGGTIQIKDPTSDQMLDVSKLTGENIKELKKFQDEAQKGPIDVAKEQLSVQKTMVLKLEEIKNAGIFGTGLEKGLKIPDSIEEKLITVADTFADKLKKGIGDSTLPETIIDGYAGSLTKLKEVITKQLTQLSNLITQAENRVKAMSLNARTGTIDNDADGKYADGDPKDLDDNDPAKDFILPSDSSTMITADLGGIIKKIIPDKSDYLMGAPKEIFDELFSLANLGNQSAKVLPNLNKTLGIESLSKFVEQKITTESTMKNEINLGGSTEVVLKIESNIPNDLLSKIADSEEIKNNVTSIINNRLSKDFGKDLVNALE